MPSSQLLDIKNYLVIPKSCENIAKGHTKFEAEPLQIIENDIGKYPERASSNHSLPFLVLLSREVFTSHTLIQILLKASLRLRSSLSVLLEDFLDKKLPSHNIQHSLILVLEANHPNFTRHRMGINWLSFLDICFGGIPTSISTILCPK